MSMTIHVDIVSAEASIFSGLAEMVFAPGELGELGIAPRHAPLVTRLKPGEVRVNTGKVELDFFISGGILEIQPHLVTVLADTAVRADDLDEAKALAAKKQAEEVLANKTSDIDFAKAQAELAEAAAQLQAISRLRKTR
ncbi:MAG: F-type H+-transporting ATPase subunit epsilon [Cycloclasticus pugetii]|jgi:F-type H+-transporting ATPase subunit epsilon|uniref:ATP synthase epsilon chain n=2 Tax=Cycloclasticus TaxID=34067 RepID=S5TAR9_9GAMM|nr:MULTISPECIES: F0F1 ATP synthase subunit epsilon [Cycloclasticus]AFT68236.1 H+-transporting two-sector ATPase, delta/epsilon subunit [Cycloclasticus sp. P1]AGS40826.1 F-type H+-transporting ATPase subunit epsilon [Cycloclasticus zancles 78-ME]ATI02232.1 F0F1 ATP synthase subunit epsilon [Cycloclasticus sp. PY97N]EPD12198.1 H+-transporting two-sector ATPase subunit delta/epsilon [Cycloclasticus pugetii]MBV1899814.1 F0F1 ATP synthase subunit epsilon [Cycloclasticus sp.]|tara:strand:- start:1090 stop:1506 length:417 start_codon:yes stop_codon:yes gene_type:complete